MSSQHEPITVLIADDHEITRKGIRHFLEQVPDIQVIGEAQDGIETRQLIAELRPRIVLLDLLMPNHSPVEFEKWVQADYPETRTLVLTAHARDVYLSGMMEAGAVGFLDKKLKGNDLLNTIRRAARGEAVYTKEQWNERAAGEKM